MKIESNQIASVEPFGTMNGKPVSIIRLKGGLNMAATRNDKGEEDVLAVASHQAILSYTLEQRYSSYQPMLMKSEGLTNPKAESHSHFLTDDLRKSGHDIYSVQNGDDVDFFITKQNIKVGSAKATIENDTMLCKSLDSTEEFLHCLGAAVAEKALMYNLKSVRMK